MMFDVRRVKTWNATTRALHVLELVRTMSLIHEDEWPKELWHQVTLPWRCNQLPATCGSGRIR